MNVFPWIPRSGASFPGLWREQDAISKFVLACLFLSIVFMPFDLLPVCYPITRLSYYFLIPAALLQLPRTIRLILHTPAAWGLTGLILVMFAVEAAAAVFSVVPFREAVKSYIGITVRTGAALLFALTFAAAWRIYPAGLIRRVYAGALFLVVFACTCWAMIENAWQMGGETAENILTAATPWFRQVATHNDWWPPLLWEGRIRAFFSEPSYYCIFLSGMIVFLADLSASTRQRFMWSLLLLLLMLELLLTKSRTGAILVWGGIGMLLLQWAVFRRFSFRRWLFAAVLFFAVFSVAVQGSKFLSGICVQKARGAVMTDAMDMRGGTTSTRMALHKTELTLIMERPVFGYGASARNQMIAAKWKDRPREEIPHEFLTWLDCESFPLLNFYTARAVGSGLLDLAFFLAVLGYPLLFFLVRLVVKKRAPSPQDMVLHSMTCAMLLGIASADAVYAVSFLFFWGWSCAVIFPRGKIGETVHAR